MRLVQPSELQIFSDDGFEVFPLGKWVVGEFTFYRLLGTSFLASLATVVAFSPVQHMDILSLGENAMGLGNLIDKAGLTKSNLKEAAKLGVGAGVFPFVWGLVQSQLLLKASPATFAQGTPAEMGARAVAGVVLGHVTGRMLKQPAMGDGMVASAVGSVVRDVVAPLFNPAAAAAQQAVTAVEQATGQDQMSGVNPLGRGLSGLSGLGNMRYGRDPSVLFGVGTPDMSATKMFNGATVAIESEGLSGATVAIEPVSQFASAFS